MLCANLLINSEHNTKNNTKDILRITIARNYPIVKPEYPYPMKVCGCAIIYCRQLTGLSPIIVHEAVYCRGMKILYSI